MRSVKVGEKHPTRSSAPPISNFFEEKSRFYCAGDRRSLQDGQCIQSNAEVTDGERQITTPIYNPVVIILMSAQKVLCSQRRARSLKLSQRLTI